MDLYEILGVNKDATDEDIKMSFRKLAQKYHPDREGGDEEKFKQIKHAYEILGDAEKRKRYDDTGDVGEDVTDYEASAIQTLRNYFNLAINQNKINIMDYCSDALIGAMGELNIYIRDSNREKKRLTRMRNLIKRKNEGANEFLLIIDSKISEVKNAIKGAESGIKITELALKILSNDYEHGTYAEDDQVQTQVLGKISW